MPVITGLYAALAALLVVFLGYRVAAVRLVRQIALGGGGDRMLEQRMRVHGNAVEYLPLALLQLALLELTGHAGWIVHLCGAVLIVSRLLHAWGLSRHYGKSVGRLLGIVGTWGVMMAMAVLLLVRFAA
ncbi:MAPEG family protein [Rehaibacterium terrae]|uniref:MAPEG family protein n=1 Tax=Rehaibacterium terrae TaxID=1341696 RepID=UPI0039191468